MEKAKRRPGPDHPWRQTYKSWRPERKSIWGKPRKLEVADYEEIKRRYAAGETQEALAEAFGVAQANISYIVNKIN